MPTEILSANQSSSRTDDNERYPPTIVGWLARIISLGLLATLLSIIGWQIAQPERDISFSTRILDDRTRSVDQRTLVPIEITNEGSTTARLIKLKISSGTEQETLEIPMLGQNETVTYFVSFPERSGPFNHSIVSYEAP